MTLLYTLIFGVIVMFTSAIILIKMGGLLATIAAVFLLLYTVIFPTIIASIGNSLLRITTQHKAENKKEEEPK